MINVFNRQIICFWGCLFILVAGVSQSGRAADGEMEIGMLYRYQVYALDMEDLDPSNGYGFVFRYWLNDTSTIEAELQQSISTWEIKTPGGSEDLQFTRHTICASLVYLPRLDFLARPTLGIGVGFQQWSAESDLTKKEEGQSFLAFGSVGLEFRLWDFVTIGPTARFTYFQFKESFLQELYESPYLPEGKLARDEEDFEHVGVIEVGINITFLLN